MAKRKVVCKDGQCRLIKMAPNNSIYNSSPSYISTKQASTGKKKASKTKKPIKGQGKSKGSKKKKIVGKGKKKSKCEKKKAKKA